MRLACSHIFLAVPDVLACRSSCQFLLCLRVDVCSPISLSAILCLFAFPPGYLLRLLAYACPFPVVLVNIHTCLAHLCVLACLLACLVSPTSPCMPSCVYVAPL